MINLPLLAKVPFIMNIVMVVWVFITISLILLILIQKGKGGGLSGAFGGLGAGGLLGTKTGDFLTWVTIGFVVGFLGLAVLLVKYYKPIPPEDIIPTAPMSLDGAPSAPTDEGPAGGEATETPTTTPGGEETTPGGTPTDNEGAPPEGSAPNPAETTDE